MASPTPPQILWPAALGYSTSYLFQKEGRNPPPTWPSLLSELWGPGYVAKGT